MRPPSRRAPGAALAVAAALVISGAVIALQPLDAPWTQYADADATYAGSSANLLLGERTRYVAHPGLPLQELLAVTFAGDWLVARATGDDTSLREHVDALLLDLDGATPLYRTWAVLFYLGAAAMVAYAAFRALGHWTWGVAAAALWVGAPGLSDMSIQYRPDVALAGLVALIVHLIHRGVVERSARALGGAALVLGFAVTVKLHALVLAPVLVAAAVATRDPGAVAELRAAATRTLSRYRLAFGAIAAAWLALAVALNAATWPFGPAPSQRTTAAAVVLPLLAYAAACAVARRRGGSLAQRVFDPFLATLAGLACAGFALPSSLAVGDAFLMLDTMRVTFSGGGVSEGVEAFSTPLREIVASIRWGAIVIVLGAGAAVVGAFRRDSLALVWGASSALLALVAAARYAAPHYYAPAFVAAIPAALWVVRGGSRRATPLAAPLVALVALPAFDAARHQVPVPTPACETTPERAVGGRLGPGEAAAVATPSRDTMYYAFVEAYVNYSPPYRYRLFPADADAEQRATANGLELAWYYGPEERSPPGTPVARYDGCVVVELRRA